MKEKRVIQKGALAADWAKFQIARLADPSVRRMMFRKAIAELEERRSKKQ
jgi:hypothetical protein